MAGFEHATGVKDAFFRQGCSPIGASFPALFRVEGKRVRNHEGARAASLQPTSAREGFTRRFEVVPAITPELKKCVFRMRHQVYCEDLQYESVRPDGLEIDEYDSSATHVLLRYTLTHEFIGCARLVRTRPDNPAYPLPFEQICAATLDRRIVDPAGLPRHTIAEVSRLAVISKYRRRRGELKNVAPISDDDFGVPGHPRFPYILVSLYFGIVAVAQLQAIEKLFLLSEPRLATHFSRLGVEVIRIGGPVDHRGLRVPGMMQVRKIVETMNPFSRPLYDEILQELQPCFVRSQ